MGKRTVQNKKRPTKKVAPYQEAVRLWSVRTVELETMVASLRADLEKATRLPPAGTVVAASQDRCDAQTWRKVKQEIVKWLSSEQLEAAKISRVEPWFYALEWVNIRRDEIFAHPQNVLTVTKETTPEFNLSWYW